MVVAKFGGSSLSCGQNFCIVKDIVERNKIPVVIVSAPGGSEKITDLLIAAYKKWEKTGSCEGEETDKIRNRFGEISSKLNVDIGPRLKALEAAINAGCGYDYAVSRGENLSARILAEALGYNFIDAEKCVKLTLDGNIDFRSTKAHSVNIVTPCVIPGFYGLMPSGKVKLLPRGGSDISGALIAAALNADYEKWTDVDGIYNNWGGVTERLDYDEAELLCYFGATVVQYRTFAVLKKAGVKMTVKNTFSSVGKGTTVSDKPCESYAFSSKSMFLGFDKAESHKANIEACGLKVAFEAKLLDKSVLLIDDCSFSQRALRRILGTDAERVNVTALVGKAPEDFRAGKLLFGTKAGKIYLS